jgi:putative flippase GtrA
MIVERDLLKFMVVGVIATGAHYFLLIILVQFVYAEPIFASTYGFILGAVVSYSLNHSFTFKSTRRHLSAVPRFIATAMSGMLLNAILIAVGVHLLFFNYLFAQVISTGCVLLWNYAINKHWTFSGS